MIRVRFAPSPTGFLHIGGARTALFNWMYAKAQGGQLILRIEDTDQARSKKEFLDEILDSMQWLGFDWDELYHQSERFALYREHAETLLKKGAARRDGDAVILNMPQAEVVLYDIIRGEIRFDTATIKDQVLIKSDGSPTYSFACVVDDALMKVSHVIRGDDHISNTPKQILMYQALGFPLPKYAHLPLITDPDGGRLSKRTGAVAVSEYRRMGFLPDALVNYLMLLGWSPGGNQEVVACKNAIKKFSIKKINKTPAAFSLDKLRWMNDQYIKQMPASALTDLVIPLLQEKGYISEDFDRKRLESIVELYKGRMPTLTDFVERAAFLFVDDITLDPQAKKQFLVPGHKRAFTMLAERLGALDTFDITTAEQIFRSLVDELGMAATELVHPVRVALTGTTVGIGLFDAMALLGKEKTIQRLTGAYR